MSRKIKFGEWVLILFLLAQIADGALTYAALHHFGIEAEGNPILKTWITILGPGSVVGAKIVAGACGVILYSSGLHHVLSGLTALYVFAAIIPWVGIFTL